MEKYKVRITRQAKEHLQGIRDYIAATIFQPETAKKMMELFRTEMQSLSEMSKRYRVVDEEPWGSYGIRKMRVKNFYVYFWINDEKKQVQIIAVIYVKREQINQLEKMVLEDDE